MNINLKDVQKWYADKINKQVIELDSYDLFCAKVAYDYACEQLTIPAVVGQSEQLPNRCSVCGRTDEERLTMTSMCGVSACPY